MSESRQLDNLKPRGRSRVTNARISGKINSRSLFAGEVDGRSLWARRYRDLVAGYVDDAGGVGALSELRLSLIRRVAALTCEAERLEVDLASGKTIDVDLLARLSSHIRRIAETIGLDRKVKTIEPTLAEIIARHAEKPAAKPAKARQVIAGTILQAEGDLPAGDRPGRHSEGAE
ncbi:hypothetical protein WOC76_12640 [Methylocystis sp. IM3]|uniref:hypothetical protein n=1 Tax=unclassified Methylocystis TaxID=2625913 RepID=UPI0030F8A5D6